jgi:hypothetical protein
MNSHKYLEHLKDLQVKAKQIMKQNSMLNNFPSPPPLERSTINEVNLKEEQIRVPVLLPQSYLQKSTKSKPPAMHLKTRTGEVLSIHLLNDSVPIFDPLIRAEAKISKTSLGSSSILADIHCPGKGRLLKSLSPLKPKPASFDLPLPEGLPLIRESTPKGKVEKHFFREPETSSSINDVERNWVSERMKTYSLHIKNTFKPQTSLKKQAELEMLKEKLRREKPSGSKRIKLLKLGD